MSGKFLLTSCSDTYTHSQWEFIKYELVAGCWSIMTFLCLPMGIHLQTFFWTRMSQLTPTTLYNRACSCGHLQSFAFYEAWTKTPASETSKIVTTVTDFVQQHGFAAEAQRRTSVSNAMGVTLAEIKSHLLAEVPQLARKGLSRTTIHELFVAPQKKKRRNASMTSWFGECKSSWEGQLPAI